MKILLLGAAGAMAQVTARDLLESSVEKIGLGDINFERVSTFAKTLDDERALAIRLDVREPARLASEMKRWDAVINSTWYEFNLLAMNSAIRAGIHYLDLGGLYHMTLKQRKFNRAARDAGVTCVLGMGSSPGTTNVMAAQGASKLERVHSIKIRTGAATLRRSGQFRSPYSFRTVLDEFTMPAMILRKGKMKKVPPMSHSERFKLPEPIGEVEGFYTLHSELATLPLTIGKGVQEIDFIVTFSPLFAQTVQSMIRLGMARREALAVQGKKISPYEFIASVVDGLPRPNQTDKDVAVRRVEIRGQRNGENVNLIYDSMSWPHRRWKIGGRTLSTGVPPSIVAQWLASHKIRSHGVLAPEECIDPISYFKELNAQGRGIKTYERSEETRPLF